MKCELCGYGMEAAIGFYRVNETGVKGVWRCWNCLTPEQRKAHGHDGVSEVMDPNRDAD